MVNDLGGFSEAEKRLFRLLGEDESLLEEESVRIYSSAMIIYRKAVDRVFLRGLQGPAVDALRLAYGAIIHGKEYRRSESFDSLIAAALAT